MLVLIVEFHIKPQHIAVFEVAMAHNAHVSRTTEPGCKQFDICRDAANPGLFYLYELYDDAAAIRAHLESQHFLDFSATVADWVASKTVRQLTRWQA
jgi:(4S)-4-hydroxy-5-phosphonooxypentane-2,3-dione isomerase